LAASVLVASVWMSCEEGIGNADYRHFVKNDGRLLALSLVGLVSASGYACAVVGDHRAFDELVLELLRRWPLPVRWSCGGKIEERETSIGTKRS